MVQELINHNQLLRVNFSCKQTSLHSLTAGQKLRVDKTKEFEQHQNTTTYAYTVHTVCAHSIRAGFILNVKAGVRQPPSLQIYTLIRVNLHNPMEGIGKKWIRAAVNCCSKLGIFMVSDMKWKFFKFASIKIKSERGGGQLFFLG